MNENHEFQHRVSGYLLKVTQKDYMNYAGGSIIEFQL